MTVSKQKLWCSKANRNCGVLRHQFLTVENKNCGVLRHQFLTVKNRNCGVLRHQFPTVSLDNSMRQNRKMLIFGQKTPELGWCLGAEMAPCFIRHIKGNERTVAHAQVSSSLPTCSFDFTNRYLLLIAWLRLYWTEMIQRTKCC